METVKLRVPIEDAVRERVGELKRAGALWVACCPFHDEKTPSFKVDPRRGTWHCYGSCGTGGDVLSFVEQFDGVAFSDALELLAAQAGVELPGNWRSGRGGDDGERYQALYAVLEQAQEAFRRCLNGPTGQRALSYLQRRGITAETADAFGLGFVPEQGSPLTELARRSGKEALEASVAAGLVRQSEGRTYDFFRGRLMIPIRDPRGRTVGFGGRKLSDDSEGPKYVNTSETPVFKKGRLVYGLDRAMEGARRERHLILVEGYTDVMAAHQVGVRNVVAVLGTSTTEEHAALVRRTGARRVTLVFDGDEAGRKASLRALAGLLALPIEIDVLRLPSGADPCDLLLERGADAFRELVGAAEPWLDFAVGGLAGRSDVALSEGVDEILRLIQALPKPVHREASIASLAERLELPAEAVRQQSHGLGRRGAPTPPEPTRKPAPVRPEELDLVGRLELEAFGDLTGAVLLDNSVIPIVHEWFGRSPDPEIAEILRIVLELYETTDDEAPIDASRVLTELGEHPARDRVVPLAERAGRAETTFQVAEGAARRLKQIAAERAIAETKTIYESAPDDEARSRALLDIWKTARERAGAGARGA